MMGTIKNLDKINRIKRDKVRRGMEYIDSQNQIEPVIDKVVVFGSSIRDDCTEESDIDICFYTRYDCDNLIFREIYGGMEREMDDLCDILRYHKLNDSFKKVIENGVVAYEI